ncbi:MAG: diphthine synthase [Candidatus Aenigmatarchaeota archaeon]
MLYLISLGLYDEKDMSIRALETAQKCDILYLELYTTRMNIDEKKLNKLIGKPVKEIKRSDLEEGIETILKEAKEKNVGILVGGDALVATTHTSIILDAKKAGIETQVIHGSSIYSAIGESGLQPYKFGATTTIAYPQDNYKPTSCYETIQKNKKNGLHTLVLLDVKSEENRYMTVKEGLEILIDMEKEKKQDVITEETLVIGVYQIGGEQQIVSGKAKELITKNIKTTPSVILIPGELHFLEKEFIESV